jgi:calcineurin-like phosphoesterase family protein
MELYYNVRGKFRILQFTDLHLGTYPSNVRDQQTYAGIKKIVKEQQPDLLVFTGDIIYSVADHGAKNPKESFKKFMIFINRLDVPSVLTFGNHDSEEQITRQELRDIYQKYAKHQVKKKHVFLVEDRENYIIELKDSITDQVKQVLYIIDSGDYSNTDYSYYAWVLPEQIDWFKETSEKYKKNDQVKRNLIFQHIPIPEYWLASQNILAGKFNEDAAMNLEWTEEVKNQKNESLLYKNGVFSPEINSGLFFQMLLNEEVWGMFVGHDHDNSFDGLHKGIHLVYGQSSGYNSYGSEPKGARVIELDNQTQTIETYSIFYE